MHISTLFAFFLILTACGKSRESEPAPASNQRLVPPFVPTPRLALGSPNLPPITGRPQVMEAIDVILTYEDSPRLQSADDKAVMSLLKEYQSGRREMHLLFGDTINVGGYSARASYVCTDDVYVLSRKVQTSRDNLALMVYHEAQHDVFCADFLRAHGIRRDQLLHSGLDVDACTVETPAYAAQVRLLAAMLDVGREPTVFSMQDGQDYAGMQRLYDAWQAIDQDGFCPWYTQMRAAFKTGG